jgi:hypothetical protein
MFGHDNDDDKQKNQQAGGGKVIEPIPSGSLAASADDIAQITNSPSGPPPPNDLSFVASDDSKSSAKPKDQPASPSQGKAPSDDLLSIKQQALQHLQPLVSHLDQAPEEKFKTTMMMIQATDDQNMLKTAFEAAKAITDDKTRAQALLDVINEINYFTQNQSQ